MGILIEHFAGAFPLWLAPEQVRVLPISDKVADYSRQVLLSIAGKRLSGNASTYVPRRSEPRSATCSSRRFRRCWSWVPRRPRARPSRTATGSTAIKGRCRWTRRCAAGCRARQPEEPRRVAAPAVPAEEQEAEQHTY